MHTVMLGNRVVGDTYPTYIVAEIGGNFLTFQEAKKLIDLAYSAGADAVKLQTYRADTIAAKSAMYEMPNTGVANQYELFKKYEIDFTLHKDIWDYCHEKGIFIFSTPSHMEDVALLEKLDCQVYKIGSDDAYNIPFLKEVAAVGKPIILSTGMCTLDEVKESVTTVLDQGNQDLILLHCVTNYPTDPAHVNLRCIPTMKNAFDIPVGFSDHTCGIECCLGAVALGANMIEKHFTYDKKAEGPDHMLSAEPEEFKLMVEGIRTLENALGDGVKRPSDGEQLTRVNNRKSIVSTKKIAKGVRITRDMIAIKRPGFGIEPKCLDDVIGRVAKSDIEAEIPLLWEYI